MYSKGGYLYASGQCRVGMGMVKRDRASLGLLNGMDTNFRLTKSNLNVLIICNIN